jgi:hypothetical protein
MRRLGEYKSVKAQRDQLERQMERIADPKALADARKLLRQANKRLEQLQKEL